jgi:tRNA(fMet)-specific endonuclease VapC
LNRVLVDSDGYTAFKRGHPDVIAVLEQADAIGVPVIVLGELRAGFKFGSREAENLVDLEQFLSSPAVSLVFLDQGTTEAYATISLELRRKGKPIPVNDLWVAALARQHGDGILSFDAHYAPIDGLRVGSTVAGLLEP